MARRLSVYLNPNWATAYPVSLFLTQKKNPCVSVCISSSRPLYPLLPNLIWMNMAPGKESSWISGLMDQDPIPEQQTFLFPYSNWTVYNMLRCGISAAIYGWDPISAATSNLRNIILQILVKPSGKQLTI